MLLRLAGSRAFCKRSRLPKLIVSSCYSQQSSVKSFPANFLRINIYLTQKIGDDMLWNIAVNDAGAEYDPLTLLRSRTMFGRPDWKSIYGRMRQAIESGQYIPGASSQLKTTVGVCLMLASLHSRLTQTMLDVLLRPYSHCEGYQGGNCGKFVCCCQLHFCEGECSRFRSFTPPDLYTGALLSYNWLTAHPGV